MDGITDAWAAIGDGDCTAVDIGIRVGPLAALISLGKKIKQNHCKNLSDQNALIIMYWHLWKMPRQME